MAVPSSGSLSFASIRGELMSNTYSADTKASSSLTSMSTGALSTINTANSSANRPDGNTPHAVSEFYSYDHDLTSVDFTSTMTVGVSLNFYGNFYGYSAGTPGIGSMTATSFDGNTLAAVYKFESNFQDYITVIFNTSRTDFDDITINGTSFGASSTWYTAGSNAWRKNTTANPFGTTSGASIVITAEYS